MALKLPPANSTASTATSSSGHAQPPPHSSYHGRRLMQMLFRASNNNESESVGAAARCPSAPSRGPKDAPEPADPRAEEDASAVPSSAHSAHIVAGAPPRHAQAPAAPPSKFHSLKRKLFPSRMRTALPSRIPPLVTSPISASTLESSATPSPATDASAAGAASAAAIALRNSSSNSHNEKEPDAPRTPLRPRSADGEPELGSARIDVPFDALSPIALSSSDQEHDAFGSGLRPGGAELERMGKIRGDDDDDDLELEIAIESIDTGTEEETLKEMNKAIEALRQWKQAHAEETQSALQRIDESDGNSDAELRAAMQAAESESRALEQEYERKLQQWKLDREALSEDRKRLEALLQSAMPKMTLAADEIARVEQALLEGAQTQAALELGDSCDGASSDAATRLRNEVFDMGVRELSAAMQASLMLEIEDAESELDRKLIDVQAFTADLDSVLAQFDASLSASSDAGSNDAGGAGASAYLSGAGGDEDASTASWSSDAIEREGSPRAT